MEIMGKEVLWIKNEKLSMNAVMRVGITEQLTNIPNSTKLFDYYLRGGKKVE